VTSKADISRDIKVPWALDHQYPVLFSTARNKVLACGRRWGKTTLCLKIAIQGHGPPQPDGTRLYKGAKDRARIWWVAPVYSQSVGVWAALKAATAPRGAREREDNASVIRKSEVERTIWFPGGGSISVKTADDPDNLRGFGLDGVILDEAAFMKEATWNQVLRPALLDRAGWAFFISTPNGENWFYELFSSASERENWERWQQPTWANPNISRDEIEDMRSDPRISSLEFLQEIEAQFVSAGAGMFNRDWFRYYERDETAVDIFYDLDARRYPTNHCRIFCTVDLAVTTKTTSHFTVISTWAITPESDLLLVDCVRARYEGPDILPVIRRVNERWKPAYIAIERVGFQLSLVQQARKEGLPVTELKPVADKVTRAMTAVAYMEGGKVWFPKDAAWMKDLEHELVTFPEGEFDDFVDTLSYAASEVASARWEGVAAPVGIASNRRWLKP
jgi:predicted phage terminase large subunit-like protein